MKAGTRPNTGASERVAIDLVANRHDGFTYPPVESVIEIEIMPMETDRPAG